MNVNLFHFCLTCLCKSVIDGVDCTEVGISSYCFIAFLFHYMKFICFVTEKFAKVMLLLFFEVSGWHERTLSCMSLSHSTCSFYSHLQHGMSTVVSKLIKKCVCNFMTVKLVRSVISLLQPSSPSLLQVLPH